MRKNLKSLAPTLWFVIIAFIISIFAVWGGAGRLGESRNANIIVSVGKEKISADIYMQDLMQRLEMLKTKFKELDKNFIQQLNIPQQVLEQIIQQTILLQRAKEMGIEASDEEIKEKITSYPVFQKDGKFIGFEQYQKILDWNRIRVSKFEENLKKEIEIEKIVNAITSGITVSREELWKNYKNSNESARLEYIFIETDKTELKEESSSIEIQEFFKKNQDKYKIPEKREAEFVFFITEDLKNEIELNDLETEKYYKDNLSQFKETEKIRASRIYIPFKDKEKELVLAEAHNILDKIKGGDNFGELAKKYSKDEKAKENGDWGLFEWKRLSSDEQEKIEKLPKGDISPVIELEEGLSILKITEKEPSRQKTLEEVKERITSILKDQKARELIEKRVNNLEKVSRREKSLDVASQKLGYKPKSTGLLKDGEAMEDIDPSGSISTAIFKLEEKEISSPIYTYKGVGLVQLQRTEPPRPANLEEVEDDVKKDLTNIKNKEKAFEKMKEIKAQYNGISLEKLAEKNNLEYKTIEEHKREQYISIVGESPGVDKLAFTLPLDELSEPIEFEGGYTLIRVLERNEVTNEDFEKNIDTEKNNFLETKKNIFFQSYLSKLREEKGVKIKYDLFLKINSDILSRFERD